MKSSKLVAEVACSEEQIFMTKYNDVFDGLGKFPFKHHITIKADAKPSIRPARRVPFRLKDRLKKALGELENRGVIARVDEPTEWVSNLVIAEKPNGSLRVCLDPKFLNEPIERERTYIPTRDDIKTALQGKKIFTVMDMKDGFYHIELDEESSKLCTFSSPFGRYRFLRMPFGISSAPEVFQKCSTSAFDGIEGVVVYFDDVIVAAESEEKHDELLKEVMEKAKQFGVKFNKSKMQFKQKSVKYVGLIFSSEGVSADPKTDDHNTSIYSVNMEVKTKLKARQSVFWPDMNRDITNFISRCGPCQKYQNKLPKEPLMSHSIPILAFNKIGLDIADVNGVPYLVTVGYYSKWIEVDKLKSKSAASVINCLKRIFQTSGIPKTIVTDNVPFNSYEMKEFASDFDIELCFISPGHSQSNGLAEKSVGIIKKLFKKINYDEKRFWYALLEYRNSPIIDLGLSPAQLLHKRVLRILIPSTTSTLKPALPENIGNKIEESQKKQALNYDKSAVKKKQDLCTQVGQRVLVREGSVWIPKKLVGPAAVPRSFYVEGEDGRQLKRNSRWIRQFTQGQDRSPSSSSEASHSSQSLTNRRYPTKKQSNKQ
ncbi:unnamed protein product [Nesidiocoris tenuis]|uniref:RNA-directed DNA polymerase n=1 Tax=Nesidiocoris tenuis TaxID=355587 RepID=A0A6H5HMI2_9HEMI|nr:unnamed protein product [Nesidiocoris tenuis]